MFGIRHSLHRGFREAKQFYFSYTAMVVVAAGIVLIPGAPLGLITTSVQALAGLLLPSASVFLLLLCNDREVLGPWVNPRWLNGVAAVIISVLLVLSGVLMATTLFPNIDVNAVFIWLAVALAAGGVAVLVDAARHRRAQRPAQRPRLRPNDARSRSCPGACRRSPCSSRSNGRRDCGSASSRLRGYLVAQRHPAADKSHPARRGVAIPHGRSQPQIASGSEPKVPAAKAANSA